MTRWEYRTPGTALWWSDVAGWCAAARRLLGPALFGPAFGGARSPCGSAALVDDRGRDRCRRHRGRARPVEARAARPCAAAARSAGTCPADAAHRRACEPVQHGLPAMPTRFPAGGNWIAVHGHGKPPAVIRSPCPTGGKCQPWVDTFTGVLPHCSPLLVPMGAPGRVPAGRLFPVYERFCGRFRRPLPEMDKNPSWLLRCSPLFAARDAPAGGRPHKAGPPSGVFRSRAVRRTRPWAVPRKPIRR